MKNLLSLTAILMLSLAANCQTEQFNFSDAFYFVREIKTTGLQARNFRISIRVKEEPGDSLSKPRVYAVQVRKGKEDIIGHTMTYASVQEGDWKTYTVDGIIDSAATRLWFFSAVNGNGHFYFDQLRFLIADETGEFRQLNLPNFSFEDKKILNGFYKSEFDPSRTKLQHSALAIEGTQSLEIVTTGQKPGAFRAMARQ